MPPLALASRAGAHSIRRGPSSSLATLVSLSKLLHVVPAAWSHAKRSGGGGAQYAALSTGGGGYGSWAEVPIEPEDPPGSPEFFWKLAFSVGLVLLGGVFAGLTLALMGSDDLNLRVLATSSDDPAERDSANKVLRLLARGRHWVLVVLLLSNVIVNESLPIFLDAVLGGGVAAVVVSTTMIVIFGEIIPQAVCVRYGLSIGGACAPLVLGMMYLFAPIAWPIAKLLDYVLGVGEGNTYKKAELKSFLQFHREGEEPLRDDEIVILNGVLSLNEKHVQEIMTPIADCLTLPADKVLDHEAIDHILLSGFSRIPIHEPGQRDNFIGMLLVKRLITYNPEDEWPVSRFPLLPLPEARPSINCFQALDYFQTGRAHLLLISNTPGQRGGALGIVSLEDLIEEIIGEEIIDETDRFQDNHSKKQATRKGTAAIMKGIIERNRVINALSRHPSRRGSSTPIPPTGANPGSAPSDGILIQIDGGNLVAEPVNIGESGQQDAHGHALATATVSDGRRLVVGDPTMSPIAEAREGGSVDSHPGLEGGGRGDGAGARETHDTLEVPTIRVGAGASGAGADAGAGSSANGAQGAVNGEESGMAEANVSAGANASASASEAGDEPVSRSGSASGSEEGARGTGGEGPSAQGSGVGSGGNSGGKTGKKGKNAKARAKAKAKKNAGTSRENLLDD